LLAAFQSLLMHYAKQDDILVGTPIANRNRSETEGLIGCFINTLVLRTRFDGDPTFRQLLRRVRETTLQAFTHQDVPFEKLVEELRPVRDTSRSPLFQVMLSMHNVGMPPLTMRGLTLIPREVELGASKLDLLLNVRDTEQGLRAALEFNADLFDESYAASLLRHLDLLLCEIAARPDARLSELAGVVAEDERRRQGEREAELEAAGRRKYQKVRRKVAVGTLLRQGDGHEVN
jgi:non-ribosomal peptide synthetase component F